MLYPVRIYRLQKGEAENYEAEGIRKVGSMGNYQEGQETVPRLNPSLGNTVSASIYRCEVRNDVSNAAWVKE